MNVYERKEATIPKIDPMLVRSNHHLCLLTIINIQIQTHFNTLLIDQKTEIESGEKKEITQENRYGIVAKIQAVREAMWSGAMPNPKPENEPISPIPAAQNHSAFSA